MIKTVSPPQPFPTAQDLGRPLTTQEIFLRWLLGVLQDMEDNPDE